MRAAKSPSPSGITMFPARSTSKQSAPNRGFSQSEFAKRYGFSVRTLQDWEFGRTQPPSAVRAYLIVIDRFPDAVERALKGAA